MIFLFFIVYLIIGFFAGLFSGLLGIGGGLIVVPALVWVFTWQGISPANIMHLAAGTSLAAMIFSVGSSTRGHHKRGFVDWVIFKKMLMGVLVGVVGGAVLASFLPTRILEIIFGVMVILIAGLLLTNIQPAKERTLPSIFPLSLAASGIGIVSGLLGLGGGTLTVPYLVYCNVALRNAIGIAAALGFMVAIIGTVSFILAGLSAAHLPLWSTGYIYWPAALGIALASPFSATLGVKLSHRLPVNILRKVFAVFLILVGLDMLF